MTNISIVKSLLRQTDSAKDKPPTASILSNPGKRVKAINNNPKFSLVGEVTGYVL